MIAEKHRVSIGVYNKRVVECVECGELLMFRQHCIGFNDAPFRAQYYADVDVLAVVFECPRCGTRQWYHGDEQSYRRYCRLTSVPADSPEIAAASDTAQRPASG